MGSPQSCLSIAYNRTSYSDLSTFGPFLAWPEMRSGATSSHGDREAGLTPAGFPLLTQLRTSKSRSASTRCLPAGLSVGLGRSGEVKTESEGWSESVEGDAEGRGGGRG